MYSKIVLWEMRKMAASHSTREEGVSGKYFSYVSLKTYVEALLSTDSICFHGETRKISIHIG